MFYFKIKPVFQEMWNRQKFVHVKFHFLSLSFPGPSSIPSTLKQIMYRALYGTYVKLF